MKRLLCILFVMGLLLCGCTKAPAETEPTGETAAMPTAGVGDAVIPEAEDIVIPINP